MKKYEFTKETRKIYDEIEERTRTLYRIRAVISFGDVKAGDLGGWVEKESNLSQNGNCWVYDDAVAYGTAHVLDCAKVLGHSEVSGFAKVSGYAKVLGHSEVSGCAKVSGHARVSENSVIKGFSFIHGDVVISGFAVILGHSTICGNAEISSQNHVLVIGGMGYWSDFTTFFRNGNNGISVWCGCFYKTIEEFLEQVEELHRNPKYIQLYKAAAETARLQIELNV